MTFKVVFPDFISACDAYAYGKNFKNLPSDIQDGLNDYFDGQEVNEIGGGADPDNVWVNSFSEMDSREAIVYNTDMLTNEQYETLKGEGRLEEYLEEHIDELEENLSDSFHYLGRSGFESFYVLQ